MAFNQKEYQREYEAKEGYRVMIRLPASKKEMINEMAKKYDVPVSRLFTTAFEQFYHADLSRNGKDPRDKILDAMANKDEE